MRIIPKKTRVSMEFFKGIELPDIIIACVGVTLTLLMLLSNLPFRWGAALIMFILFAASIIPVENEKAYKTVYYGIKYAMSYKTFRKNPEKRGKSRFRASRPLPEFREPLSSMGMRTAGWWWRFRPSSSVL